MYADQPHYHKLILTKRQLNLFHATGLFIFPLKTLEK